MTISNKSTHGPATPTTLSAAAQAALTLIRQAQAVLPLTSGLGAKARKSALGMAGMPTELLTEAASFLESRGDRYPYEYAVVSEAAQLEAELTPIVASAKTLISLVEGTILEKRGPAFEHALALYATLKAQSRTDASVRDTVLRMEPLANSRKTPHQRKEQRVKAKARKIAELGGIVPETTKPT
jgi:hypothetical protein